MSKEICESVLTKNALQQIFPTDKANEFFEALFGDASEGAFDIELAYKDFTGSTLKMDFLLHERVNHCLACNLTQGLPQVFSRHPIINVEGVVKEIDSLLGNTVSCLSWKLGYTEQYSSSVHAIPIIIETKNL